MRIILFFTLLFSLQKSYLQNNNSNTIGLGLKAPFDAIVLFDGTREIIDQKWTYWNGPRLSASIPIKWKVEKDPVDKGMVLNTYDDEARNGKYGAADIVTKKKFTDFRLHIEFLVKNKGGNSGVYLQNRYEIQIKDGDKTKHGMGAVINEKSAPYTIYNGLGKWNSYDIKFKAARFKNEILTKQPEVTIYFNGELIHDRVEIKKVWGGPNSGLDGGDDNGYGISPKPGGLKLQSEGHEVLYRNIWIKELNLDASNTYFN
tara:strand:+ start:338 stop:1114 length:777 start_codon:yes stop_codon:yes gene_type:complete